MVRSVASWLMRSREKSEREGGRAAVAQHIQEIKEGNQGATVACIWKNWATGYKFNGSNSVRYKQ